MTSCWPRRSVEVLLRIVLAVAVAIVTTIVVVAAARHPPRVGHGAAGRRWSAGGIGGAPRPRPQRLGLGCRRAHRPDRRHRRSRRRWRPRSPSTCWRARDRWRSASAPASSSRRARSAAVRQADRGAAPLPRARAAGPAGGLRPVPLRRRPGRADGARHRGAPAPRARGGRRRLRQARADRRHPRRPRPARDLRRAGRSCRTGSRPSPPSASGRSWRPSWAADVDERLRRVRLGAAGGGVDRSDLPGPAALRRGRRREGAAPGHRGRRWSATSPRSRCSPTSRSGARRSVRACARARCSASSRRACGPSSTSGARPTRWRRWPLLLGRTSAVRMPQVYGELCTRRLLVQERFEGFTVADTAALDGVRHRPQGARPSSCCARRSSRCCGIGFFHADPHPGNIFAFARRHARADRLRRRRAPRPDPAGGGRRHPRRARPPRRQPAARRHRAGRRHGRGDVARAARAGARAPDGRPRAATRHRRADGAPGPRRDAGASSASGCRPTSWCCRARW